MLEPPEGYFDFVDRVNNVRTLPVDILPPNDVAAEQAVVGFILTAESTERVRGVCQPWHFYNDACKVTYQASLDVEAMGDVPDIVAVRGMLSEQGKLQRVGGPDFLGEMLNEIPSISNVEQYARRIADKASIRAAINVAKRIVAEGYSAQDPSAFLASCKKLLDEVAIQRPEPIETISTLQVFEAQPPIPWICRELYLAPGRPSLIAGYGYSAKSVSTQALLLAIASGTKVWGKYAVQRMGHVLHLDHEQGKRATILRYQRLAKAMKIGPDELGDRLHVAALPRSFRLSNPDAEDVLRRAVDGFVFCGIDSLRATTPGIDENDSQIRDHLDKLLRVSEKTGCAFVVIHHAGKNGKEKDARERGRGSSAIFDACGLVLQLDGKVQDDGSTIVKVAMTKAPAEASGSALRPFVLKVDDVMDDAGMDARWGLSCEADENADEFVEGSADRFVQAKRVALECIRSTPGVRGADAVRARTGGRAMDVRQAVKELLDEGRVENFGTRARPKLRVFFVPDELDERDEF